MGNGTIGEGYVLALRGAKKSSECLAISNGPNKIWERKEDAGSNGTAPYNGEFDLVLRVDIVRAGKTF